MLTIKPPIRLNCERSMNVLQPDMEEKIRGNYTMMNPGIRTEELLHVAASAPEVYFAEGGSISILNQIQNENQQEIRLDVINNLMNRILVSHTENFRYQDTVYVSSILRKLGIRNVNEFMRQVWQLREERRESHRLVELYEDNRQMLTLLMRQEQERRQEEGHAEGAVAGEAERPEYFLQQDIYRRLDTSRIYQDMRNFSLGNGNANDHIFRTEMNMAEQTSLIQNFRLNELKQEIYRQEMPLYYYHANEYELMEDGEEQGMQRQPEERVSAALLLNLVDQAYALRQEQIEENSHSWYSVAGALFQTAENTWKRYSSYHQEGRAVEPHIRQTVIQRNEETRLEQEALTRITMELARVEQNSEEQNQYFRNTTDQYYRTEQNREETRMSGGSFHLTEEEMNLTYLETGGDEEEVTERELPKTAEEIRRQMEVYNQRNIENLKKITEIGQRQPSPVKVTVDREKARRDALRALENPETVLMEYLNTDVTNQQEEIQNQMEEEIYNLFSDETKEIYRRFVEQRNGGVPVPMQHVPLPGRPEAVQPEEPEIQQRTEHETIRQERETVRQETQLLTERLRELSGEAAHSFAEGQADRKPRQSVSFVHREEEQVISEELLETIRQQTATTVREEIQEKNTVRRNTVTETAVQEAVNHIRTEQIQNVDELIQQNVRKQLGHISDQVYGRIEKKLQTERKRRGY